MAIKYLDFEGGNDANDGSTFALRFKTVTNGATAARISAGDTIRIMGSPDPTLVGQATWTQYSKNITLASAVTANICDCETAWTGSTNVTVTADPATFKENAKSMKAVIATAFTTGKVAFFATGTLDLSAYQQISFWIFNTVAVAANTMSIRLCTDTLGATSVHTIAIPAIASTSQWVPVTVDFGSNLNAAIASVALYQDVDIAAISIQIDNIIACKASSDPASLTLTSLIGKVCNLSWAASTAYATGDERKATQPNRNGFRYRATTPGTTGTTEPIWPLEFGVPVADGDMVWTCVGLEDTWYGIQSINGTTVKLDNSVNTLASAGRGYSGSTETTATYKRETIRLSMVSSSSTTSHSVQVSGTAGNEITFIGGWDRTSMATQTGETWWDLQNGVGLVMDANGKNHLKVNNINAVRGTYGHRNNGADAANITYQNVHSNNHTFYGLYAYYTTTPTALKNVVCNNNSAAGILWEDPMESTLYGVTTNGNLGHGGSLGDTGIRVSGNYYQSKNNNGYGLACSSGGLGGGQAVDIKNFETGNNVSGGFQANTFGGGPNYNFYNALIPETTAFAGFTSLENSTVYSQKHQQTADNHLIVTDGGSIVSAIDQRHTLSGIAWKFRPTSTNRGSSYPLKLSVAKIACQANSPVSVAIWTRRDNANIVGRLKVVGGQIAGVPTDVIVVCTPTINTWTVSSTLVFTPTESGVVEVIFDCYDGVTTTSSLWVDDLMIS